MKFDNTISIGDIISILGLILTLLTLWTMIKQREDSNRPYLVLDFNNNFEYIFNIKSKDSYIEENYEDTFFYNNLYSIDKNPFDFNIKNIGNGVAREINLKIKVENIDIIKKDEKMYIEDNILVIECLEQTQDGYLKHKYLEDCDLYFTNLGSNNSFSLTNNLKRFENIVNSILFHYMDNEDFESIRNHLIPTIQVELEYKNILNKEFKEIYNIDINLWQWSSFSCMYIVNLKDNKR